MSGWYWWPKRHWGCSSWWQLIKGNMKRLCSQYSPWAIFMTMGVACMNMIAMWACWSFVVTPSSTIDEKHWTVIAAPVIILASGLCSSRQSVTVLVFEALRYTIYTECCISLFVTGCAHTTRSMAGLYKIVKASQGALKNSLQRNCLYMHYSFDLQHMQ